MASKKSRPLDDPPAASSSEEIDSSEEDPEEEEEELVASEQTDAQPEDSNEEESEQDSDDEESQEMNKKSPKSAKKIPPPDSDSDSDDQKSSDFTIKPISAIVEDAKPSPVKRRAENGKSASKSKKAKTETATPGEEEEEDGSGTAEKKSGSVNRLWSEEDEIRILKGVLEFQKLGKDVSTHHQEFLDHVKGSIHVDVTKNQLIDKVRRLKRKFKTNFERSSNGEDPSFAKAHELKAYQLCKKIWGDKNGGIDENNSTIEKASKRSKKVEKSKPVASIEAATPTPTKTLTKEKDLDLVKEKEKSEKVEVNEEVDDDMEKLYPSLMSACRTDPMCNLPVPDFVKSNLSLIGSSELKDLDAKWKKLNAAEMEVYLGRIELLREEAHIVLDAMKNNKN